jgi:hypothetical protein
MGALPSGDETPPWLEGLRGAVSEEELGLVKKLYAEPFDEESVEQLRMEPDGVLSLDNLIAKLPAIDDKNDPNAIPQRVIKAAIKARFGVEVNITAQLTFQLLHVYFPPVFRRDFHDRRSASGPWPCVHRLFTAL